MARTQAGTLAIQILETRYGSTLAHERANRRAWDRHIVERRSNGAEPRTAQLASVQRMAGALAIRRLAGAKMIHLEVAEYAWLVCSRRETLEAAMLACGAWLDERCGNEEAAFLDALREGKSGRRRIIG